MSRTYAKSAHSLRARVFLEALQSKFVFQLEELARSLGQPQPFERVEWLRDGGQHGGGHRYVQVESGLLNRAAVNVSGIHYDDLPQKKLRSADALSTIIHPRHPCAPSVHMHLSWTELRDGTGYYRIMADLNPAIEHEPSTHLFRDALREAAPEHFLEAEIQGDRYFNIPALHRHRGSTHFYLEEFSSGNFDKDTDLARRIGGAAIDSYVQILRDTLTNIPKPTTEQKREQLAYHTAYLFQVLTLDRGTTSGLLVHEKNDQGIMGSLPAFVDRALLASWKDHMQEPQDALVDKLVEALHNATPSHVTGEVRLALARVLREHYHEHPEALAMQATGDHLPPTIPNHD